MKDNSFAVKLWRSISKPFQITKLLEILYTLDWIWYAFLSYVPARYINGVLFSGLREILSAKSISLILTFIALMHMIALYNNIIWLRKVNIVFNITLLLYMATYLLQQVPIPAGTGYYMILIGVSIFAFWRMDESH